MSGASSWSLGEADAERIVVLLTAFLRESNARTALLVAITFMGGTVAYKRASFIGLQGFGHHLGPAIQQVIVVALQVLTLSCFGLIAWFGAVYTVKAAEHTSSSLQIPMAIPFAVIPVAAVILVIHVLADIARTLERKTP